MVRRLLFASVMRFADALIIYLSCGSPFAVNTILAKTDRRTLTVAVGAVLTLIFWPVTAVGSIYRLVRETDRSQSAAHSNDLGIELQKLLSKVESIAHIGRGTASAFEFRKVFDRYTGLAAEFAQVADGAAVAEIFAVTGHPSPGIASACLARKQRTRLAEHLIQARQDFVEAVTELAGTNGNSNAIGMLAIEIAEAAQDTPGASELRKLLTRPAVFETGEVFAGDTEHLWSTTEQAHSIAR